MKKEAFEVDGGVVVYHHGMYFARSSSSENALLHSLFVLCDINYVLRGNVIGNIYDQPELLEGGAEWIKQYC